MPKCKDLSKTPASERLADGVPESLYGTSALRQLNLYESNRNEKQTSHFIELIGIFQYFPFSVLCERQMKAKKRKTELLFFFLRNF